jgi:hypothetical protein
VEPDAGVNGNRFGEVVNGRSTIFLFLFHQTKAKADAIQGSAIDWITENLRPKHRWVEAGV